MFLLSFTLLIKVSALTTIHVFPIEFLIVVALKNQIILLVDLFQNSSIQVSHEPIHCFPLRSYRSFYTVQVSFIKLGFHLLFDSSFSQDLKPWILSLLRPFLITNVRFMPQAFCSLLILLLKVILDFQSSILNLSLNHFKHLFLLKATLLKLNSQSLDSLKAYSQPSLLIQQTSKM